MKASANIILVSGSPEVIIEHNGEKLHFPVSVFGKENFQKQYDVFEYINLYWESLTSQHKDRIFTIYKEIQEGFDNVWNKNELFEYLTVKSAELVSLHNLDSIQDWVSFKSDIRIPTGIDIDYTHSIDNNRTREKTYTKYDYSKLVALSLSLRCMVPVWGEYISLTRQDTGSLFKEFYAFQLLNKSDILYSVPMEKLRVYIEHNVGADNYNPNNTLNGISSEDFNYWLLSLVCIRRLCIGDIRGLDTEPHLITFLYKFIIQKIHNTDNNFENIVKLKKFDSSATNDGEKISSLERYKNKTNISLGEIVELEFSILNMYNTACKITCGLNEEMFNRSQTTSSVLLNERLLDPQMTLLRWVFKRAISPKGLMYLPKPLIVKAIGAVEAILWSRGHKYLALIASSYCVISDSELVISPVDSKMRVPKELSDELDKLYPFTRLANNKKLDSKEVNLAAKSIDIVADNLTMFNWRPTAHESMLVEVFGTSSRRIPIKPDIKSELTKLVIELGNRSWL